MRSIGPVGTACRVAVSLGLLYLAAGAWSLEASDVLLGLVAFPAVTILLGALARRAGMAPLRFTGPLGHLANCAAIVALLSNPSTSGAAALFYAATMLVAAWRGLPGCELTVLSNWILRRDDRVGCPVFWPVDTLESARRIA